MARCDHPDCGRGDVDDQGFCPVCQREPLRAPAPARAPRPDAVRAGPDAVRAGPAPEAGREAEAPPEPWWGLSLIEPGAVPVPADEPAEAGPVVPEDQRFCPKGHPVGRGRAQGFCTRCGDRFDFTRPPAFQTIADRYGVYRKLGEGAFGAALLAYDRNLDTDVVLKDLTRSVANTALRERNALVGLRHDSIVRIYGYEPKGPYLVLEYVGGTPVRAGDDRLEVILGHGLQILQALDYLHARELLHIDVKPENIIRFGELGADGPRDRVRLIDFGAVRKLGRPGPVDIYTRQYAPPKTDLEHQDPTARFDLFCLATTLRVLCRRHLREPAAPGVAALGALLGRAADIDVPGRRFVSARQFAEQLSGVIRQVVAAPPGGRRVARPSAIFGSMTEPLHGGLAAPRPLRHWIDARVSADGRLSMAVPFAAPAPADVVAAMPAPLADPGDPALTQDCEASLVACRAALRRGELDAAARSLTGARLPAWSWVRAWYGGLIALAGGDARAAAGEFGTVRDALPGELIPLLALGLCAEISGDRTRALQCYQTVAGTAPAFGAASFGLARVLLLAGRRDEAVDAAGRLAGELQAGELRFEQEARIAVVRLLAAVTDSRIPTERDLARAQEVADGLRVGGDVKIGLDGEIQYGRSRVTGDWNALSGQIRRLAAFAGTQPDFFAMIDLANRLRPPVEWWWRRLHRIRVRSAA